MKKAVAGFMAIAIIISMAGCQSNTVKKDKTIIKTATSFGSYDASTREYEIMLADFMDHNQDISVKDRSRNSDETWKSMIRSQFEDGSEPDVMFFFTAVDAKTIISSDKVVSLDEIRSVYPNYAKNIKQSALNSVKAENGNIYAVPIKGFFEGLYCNSDLFKKYNVPEITDWASLLYAIKIFRLNGITPIAASFQDIPNYLIEHSILSVGGTQAHSKTPESAEEVPKEWVDGIKELKELYDAGAFQTDAAVTQYALAQRQFNSENAAMILEGSWFDIDKSIADKIEIKAFPSKNKSDEQQSIIAGFSMGFYISRKAWNDKNKREACVKYVEYMTSDSSIAKFCKNGGAPAASVKSSESENSIVKKGIDYSGKYNFEMPIDSRLKKSAWEYIAANVVNVITGKMTSEKLFSNAMNK